MSPHLPRRFSIRTLFVLVALVAAGIYSVKEHMRLSRAREQFSRIWYGVQIGILGTEDAIEASETLMEAELASPCISRKSAEAQHAVRLFEILAHVESPWREELFEEGRAKERRHVLESAAKIDSR